MTFPVPGGKETSSQNMISIFFWFFQFSMMGNHFPFKIFRKIRKNRSVSPDAWDALKTKLFSRYFRQKTWKCMNFSIFTKFLHFHHFTILMEKLNFLILELCYAIFTTFRWRNADTKSRFQPRAGNERKWAYFN